MREKNNNIIIKKGRELKGILRAFFIKFGILEYMPPQEDKKKVNDKIEYLKKEYGGSWIQLIGFNALTIASYEVTGIIYNPSVGTPVKAFINTQTGEIKVYDARFFFKD